MADVRHVARHRLLLIQDRAQWVWQGIKSTIALGTYDRCYSEGHGTCAYELVIAQSSWSYSFIAAYSVASSDELPIGTVGGLPPNVRNTLPSTPR